MRTEKDFLGEIEIPDDVYYGVQTTRALHNFLITGHVLNDDFIAALGIVKAAAARANMRTGRMPARIGHAIVKAAEEIIAGQWQNQFVVDCIQGGAGTSMNMNANEVIANRALELLGEAKGNYQLISPNNHVNMAQSTNDVIPTAIRICTIRKAKKLMEALVALAGAFETKGTEFSQVLKMGRTHLQDAVPITLGQEFHAYAEAITRSLRRIEVTVQSLHAVNMGATAVGTGLNAEPEYIDLVTEELSRLTGESIYSAKNMVDATQNTDELAEFSGTLKVCALALSKIANDLRLMASGPKCGLNELVLPAMQPGSSNLNTVLSEPPRISPAKRRSEMTILQTTQVSRSHLISTMFSGQLPFLQPDSAAASGVSNRPPTPSWPRKSRRCRLHMLSSRSARGRQPAPCSGK